MKSDFTIRTSNSKYDFKMNRPLVTIGIPVYNVEPYIKKCLLSVLNQTYENLEVLVVDDLGTDNSMQVVNDLYHSHAKGNWIRVVTHQRNMGIGETRNTIIEEAKGEYLYFIDSDDYMEPNAIELLVDQAQEHHTDVVIASHRKETLDTGEELPTFQYNHYQLIRGRDSFAHFVCSDLRWHIAIVVWNILFSVDFLKKNNLRFEGRKDEDALFLSDYYSEVESAVIMPNITYHYVARPNSIMGYMGRHEIPIREIRERFNTDAIMTAHCSRLKGRSFYDVHCARVVKHKFRAACVALRHRERFTEKLPNEEIRLELRHPATLSDILKFKRYLFFHLFFYTIYHLNSSLAVSIYYLVGKMIRWI